MQIRVMRESEGKRVTIVIPSPRSGLPPVQLVAATREAAKSGLRACLAALKGPAVPTPS